VRGCWCYHLRGIPIVSPPTPNPPITGLHSSSFSCGCCCGCWGAGHIIGQTLHSRGRPQKPRPQQQAQLLLCRLDTHLHSSSRCCCGGWGAGGIIGQTLQQAIVWPEGVGRHKALCLLQQSQRGLQAQTSVRKTTTGSRNQCMSTCQLNCAVMWVLQQSQRGLQAQTSVRHRQQKHERNALKNP
jgi:hypothetical protein